MPRFDDVLGRIYLWHFDLYYFASGHHRRLVFIARSDPLMPGSSGVGREIGGKRFLNTNSD
ncbi:unnamed protein product [Acidithrix sp. C25]|nr:unnamed protein product [Acidithrix sp. C25]